MLSTPTDQASKADKDVLDIIQDEPLPSRQRTAISRDILLFLIAFRMLNALSNKTFFQPDEYFQSLEPAWQMAFGLNSGAWITWEWKHNLRSSIHPAIFAIVYRLSSFISRASRLSPDTHAELLIAAPKVTQAVFAALGDYYTWKLGEKIYGRDSSEAWAATAECPWQWFCSTRTLSNCLETTLTVAGLSLWPWHWSSKEAWDEGIQKSRLQTAGKQGSRSELEGLSLWAWHWSSKEAWDEGIQKSRLQTAGKQGSRSELTRLRLCLLLASLACVLRPTNLLLWVCIASYTVQFLSILEVYRLWDVVNFPKSGKVLLREAILCGSLVLSLAALIDRLYYQTWTFPPSRFLYFNIAQSLAVFYGRNDWHYYLSQGYPLLLTTYLPFTILGLYQSIIKNGIPPTQAVIKHNLAVTALLVPLTLSFISHKEVRFIYPILPILHVLTAPPIIRFFYPEPRYPARIKYIILALVLFLNIIIALLATTSHQPGPLSTIDYLRKQYTNHHLSQPPPNSFLPPAPSTMTVGFLTPCHSTPWRSHLVHPGIKAWALSCEPPIHLPPGPLRATYLDEADQFYANPLAFLRQHLGNPPPGQKSYFIGHPAPPLSSPPPPLDGEEWAWDGNEGKKIWPDYLVFFGQLEAEMRKVLGGSRYGECWRGWNGWGHEDWRRRGGMVVWCLYPER